LNDRGCAVYLLYCYYLQTVFIPTFESKQYLTIIWIKRIDSWKFIKLCLTSQYFSVLAPSSEFYQNPSLLLPNVLLIKICFEELFHLFSIPINLKVIPLLLSSSWACWFLLSSLPLFDTTLLMFHAWQLNLLQASSLVLWCRFWCC